MSKIAFLTYQDLKIHQRKLVEWRKFEFLQHNI